VRVLGGLGKGPSWLAWCENLHGIQPQGIRCRMRGALHAQAAITRMQTFSRRWLKPRPRSKSDGTPLTKKIEGNEITDGWAKIAAGEPDGVECLRHSDKHGRRRMPLPASLVHLKRRISEKKWKEVPLPDQGEGAKAHCSPVLPTEDALTATHMKAIKLRTDNHCWWCYWAKQTREHLFKHCAPWRAQKKAMWARVQKAAKRGKRKWRMAADERCSEAILEFLRTTDVGRKVRWNATEAESSESGTECPRGECVCGLCGRRAGFTRFAFLSNFAGSGAASDW